MASWFVPASLQKQLIRYAISKLEMFEDLDLHNLDYSVGSKSTLEFKDVGLKVKVSSHHPSSLQQFLLLILLLLICASYCL